MNEAIIQPCEIVIWGTSLLLCGIADALRGRDEVHVTHLDPTTSQARALVRDTDPQIIIAERGHWKSHGCDFDLSIPVIEVDVQQSVLTVYAARKIAASSIDDLLQVISQLVQVDEPIEYAH